MLRTILALSASVAVCQPVIPPVCQPSTPAAGDGNCTLPTPPDANDAREFASICQPGAAGHIGFAEKAVDRCGSVYQDGVFRCSCCGEALFYARTQYVGPDNKTTGWPSFHSPAVTSKKTSLSAVCRPTADRGEVVCANCGAHLGDYFGKDDPGFDNSSFYDDHYCVDGVCLLPPGSDEVCQPPADAPAPDEQSALAAMRELMRRAKATGNSLFAHVV